jgi:hypothetical protein
VRQQKRDEHEGDEARERGEGGRWSHRRRRRSCVDRLS